MNSNIILHVGSEETRKNVPLLIKAFATLLRELPNTILIRMGLQESSEVARIASTYDIAQKIKYLKIPRNQLPLLYSAADVFVFPSLYEGFGLPLVEAMACGCPIIASDATSIPEVVGKAGILFNPTDCPVLVKAIRDLLTDFELQADLAKRGLEQSEKFSWAVTANKTLDVYRDVLSKEANQD
jgi:glycosyltransferase involved in cell wall biosynthesis